ncbi:MAG: sugar ABC transporter substrate-binding protein [Boseongicola sp. SB0677_bin_26]|nr:sugar ABC transporter substrate-binding protein [Boseongicola sp. SB0665_bin_10]MYG28079.1 sugar ABC transporter substrate-binding protein [Boseongicola sp. SB0677_bin_26]
MHKKLAAAAVATLIALPVHAETYGVLMKTLANPFWGAMELGVREGAEAAGVDYYLQAVESDQAAEPQLNVCNTMLERQPDAMITAAINSTILLPCLKRANDMGIPVVDLDGNLDHKIAADAGVEIAFSIGSDNVAAGGQGADWLVGQLGADATGPVLVIEGLSGNITGQKRAMGFADTLAELAPGLEVVASLPGDWDRGKAANITNDILTSHPDLVAIFAANDGMALGAVETVYAAGKGGDVIVIGVDGNSDAVKSIKAGRLNASVAQLPYLVGKQAVEMVKAGGDHEDWIYVPTMVLTKAILDAGTDPMLEYVK